MLDGLAIHHNISHPQVDIGRQSAIEIDLTMTVGLPLLTFTEVEKSVPHRLPDFVDPVPSKEQQRDMSLDDAGGLRENSAGREGFALSRTLSCDRRGHSPSSLADGT